MTAHLTYCLIRLGYKDSSTVKAAFNFILTTQRKDGGWHCDRLKQPGEINESQPSCPVANIHVIRVLGQYGKKYELVAQPAIFQLLDSFNTGIIRKCEFESKQQLNPVKLRYPPHYTGLDILNIVHSLSFFSTILKNSQFENLTALILNRWDGSNWLRPEKRIPEWSAVVFGQKSGFSSWITSLFLQTIEEVYFKS